MGTTLTGLTPATTYDALIKVGDNGPLSATAKYVGDGLGNDSVVALSTSSVGIGTTSPTQLLHVAGNVRITGALYDGNNAAGTSGQILSSTGTATDWIDVSSLGVVDGSGTANYVSKWSDPNTLTNSVIYDNGTNVGIGTSLPAVKLDVVGTGYFLYANNSSGNRVIKLGTEAVSGEPAIQATLSNDTARQLLLNPNGGNILIGSATSDLARNLVVVGTTGMAVQYAASAGTYLDITPAAANGTVALTADARTGSYPDMTFRTSAAERLRITSAGNVGIGTSSPDSNLVVNGSGSVRVNLKASNARYGTIYADSGILALASITAIPLILATDDTERLRITSTGNVGIGTSSPAGNLHIASAADTGIRIQAGASSLSYIDLADTASGTPAGSIAYNHIVNAITFATGTNVERARIDSDGLKFNGDTAAANALDDYEEGTWTPTISFGGASVGVTYAAGRAGQYTKIGRQVTATAYILLTNKGTSTGAARIGGLPFTIANASGYYAAGSLGALVDITYGGQIQTYAEIGTTNYVLNDYSEAGVQGNITDADFTNVSQILFTATYFV